MGSELIRELRKTKWHTFRCAVAFAKHSGARHIASDLYEFAKRKGNTTKVAIGISSDGTSLEGLQLLWQVLDTHGELFVYHEGNGFRTSFHPKTYLLKNDNQALVYVGSNNLTEGGLFSNHEQTLVAELDMKHDAADRNLLKALETTLDAWQTRSPTCLSVDPPLLKSLHLSGHLPSEKTLRAMQKQSGGLARSSVSAPGTHHKPTTFVSSLQIRIPKPKKLPRGLPRAPVTPASVARTSSGSPSPKKPIATAGTSSTKFLIEVKHQRNGEILLSYQAVLLNPGFFGYPFSGWSTPRRKGVPPYPMATPDPIVDIHLFNKTGKKLHQHLKSHPLNVVDYARKREIRITIPNRIGRIPDLSLLVMTKDPSPGTDYLLEFHHPRSPVAALLAGHLTNSLPSGGAARSRRYGFI